MEKTRRGAGRCGRTVVGVDEEDEDVEEEELEEFEEE